MKNLNTLTIALLIAIALPASQASASLPEEPILRINTEMHSAPIRRISVDRSGKYFVTCSLDKTAKLWSVATGELIKTYRVPIDRGNDGMLYASAISPDGKKVMVGGWTGYNWDRNHSIYVFDRASGTLTKRITGFSNVINDLEYSRDGRYVAAAMGGTGGFAIISAAGFRVVKNLTGYGNTSYNVSFADDGRLATVSYDGHIRLYDRSFKEVKKTAATGGRQPFSIAFSPDGKEIAVGYNDTTRVQILDGRTLAPLHEPDTSGATDNLRLQMVAWSQDGSFLYAGGTYSINRDGAWWRVIRKWRDRGRGGYVDINGGRNGIADIKTLRDGSLVAGGSKPDLTRIDTNDRVLFYKSGEVLNFTNKDIFNYFSVDRTGKAVFFKPANRPRLVFDIVNNELVESNVKLPLAKDAVGDTRVTDWNSSFTPKLNGRALSFLEKYERSLSVSVAPDANSIVFGADWNLYSLSSSGSLRWKIPSPDVAWAVNVTGDGKTVAACYGDGTVRWHRLSDGRELLALYVHPDLERWVLWTPEGYYAGKNGDDLIGWHVNNGKGKTPHFYPASKFFETYYRPDIIARAIDGNISRYASDDITKGFKNPPTVRFVLHDGSTRGLVVAKKDSADYTVTDGKAPVRVRAVNEGGGIAKIRVFVNDKLAVEEVVRNVKAAKFENKYSVDLTSGLNLLKVVGYSTDGTESNEALLRYRYNPRTKISPDIYIIGIGINKYRNSSYNLEYCVPDIKGFVSAFEPKARKLFNKTHVSTIFDEQATRENILAELAGIKAKVKPDDVFVMYYAGHGQALEIENGKSEFFYVLHPTLQLTNLDFNRKNSISGTEMRKELKEMSATKQIMFVDACNSGTFADQFVMRGAAEENALARLSRASGTFIFASTASDQLAAEFAALKHGAFTYTIIEGLKGGAYNTKGEITINTLNDFLYETFPKVTAKYKGKEQYPKTFIFGSPFPFGLK